VPPQTFRVTADHTSDQGSWGKLAKILIAAGICVLLGGAIVAFFAVDVCDQQLSNGGSAVKVCRHLQTTDPPVLALALVVLAALGGVFFTEVSGFGVTLKREVKEAKESARAATELASENKERIEETAGDLADLGTAVIAPTGGQESVAPVTNALGEFPELDRLAQEYNRIRLTMKSGHERTREMERVVAEMKAAHRSLPGVDLTQCLRSSDRGVRLAAFASLADEPDPQLTGDLVDSLIDREDKPFGQYWGIVALGKQCEADRSALSAEMRRRLEEELLPRLSPTSDRAHELARALEACRR
jgi:hypothetical protein